MSEIIRPERILIVRTDRLGDVILSTPVIRNLRLAYPEAYLAFMCRPYTAQALQGNPYLDAVVIYDKDGMHKSIWGSIRFALALKKERFDWALILHPTTRSHLIAFFAGIKTRVGWDRKNGWLLTRAIPHHKHEGLRHETEYTLDILRSLGVPVVDRELYFPVDTETQKETDRILMEQGVNRGEEFVVIHPSASCPSKRWPLENFARLAEIIAAKTRLKIVVIAQTHDDRFPGDIFARKIALDLRGKFTIAQIGALLRRATIFISNDSGPVHIAAALHTPVISLFGRNDPGLSPRRWKPLGDGSYYIHKEVGCLTCAAHNCTRAFACLAAITPEEVAARAIEIIYR